jgi:hypothetical protein
VWLRKKFNLVVNKTHLGFNQELYCNTAMRRWQRGGLSSDPSCASDPFHIPAAAVMYRSPPYQSPTLALNI